MLRIFSKLTLAFSLIELLVVIGIIGILSIVSIPAFTAYTTRAKMLEALHHIEPYITELNEYYNNFGALRTWETQDAITVAKVVDTKIVDEIVYYNYSTTDFIMFWPRWQAGIIPEYDAGTSEARLYVIGRVTGGIVEWTCAYDTRSEFMLSENFLPGTCRSEFSGTPTVNIIR